MAKQKPKQHPKTFPKTTVISDDPAIQTEVDWIRANGGVISNKIKVHSDPMKGRFILTSSVIEDQEEVLNIPNTCWFSIHSSKISTKHKNVLKALQKEESLNEPQTLLSILLHMEQRAGNSFFEPIFHTLPASPGYPLFSSFADNNAIQSQCLTKWTTKWKLDLKKQFKLLKANFGKQFPEYFGQDFKWEEYSAAIIHIHQRAFHVDHAGVEGDWVFIPFMDLFNHSLPPVDQHELDDDHWIFRAMRKLDVGDQLFVNYGTTKSSVDFLLFYGFVLPDNPVDCVRVVLKKDKDEKKDNVVNDPLASRKQSLIDKHGYSKITNFFIDGGLNHKFLIGLLILAANEENLNIVQKLIKLKGKNKTQLNDSGLTNPEKDSWKKYRSAVYLNLATCLRAYLDSLPTSYEQDLELNHDQSRDFNERMIAAYRISFKRIVLQTIERLKDCASRMVELPEPSVSYTEEQYEDFYYLISVGISVLNVETPFSFSSLN